MDKKITSNKNSEEDVTYSEKRIRLMYQERSEILKNY